MTAADEKYRAARAAAQSKANATGFDQGLEFNAIFRTWDSFTLPSRQYRAGHELGCEVVMCETLAKCQPGHGPVRS